MSDNLTVFGTRSLARPEWPTNVKQPRVVVAAKSRAAAVRAFAAVMSMSDSHLKAYGGPTADPGEVEPAMSEPGTVFIEAAHRKYAPLRPVSS